MLLQRDRYDPSVLLAQLSGQVPSKDVTEWCFTFRCSDPENEVYDFWAYLPDDEGKHEKSRILLADFLTHLREFDNLAQATIESDYQRASRQPPRGVTIRLQDYQLHIGWMRVVDPVVIVRYWGTHVNTEWETGYRRSDDGRWTVVETDYGKTHAP